MFAYVAIFLGHSSPRYSSLQISTIIPLRNDSICLHWAAGLRKALLSVLCSMDRPAYLRPPSYFVYPIEHRTAVALVPTNGNKCVRFRMSTKCVCSKLSIRLMIR